MANDKELLLLPYDSAQGSSLISRLIDELESGAWTRFRVAVAFARATGNAKELVAALLGFAARGGQVQLTFGADTFGPDAGTDLQAIELLTSALGAFQSAEVFLYHEPGRTFHPKVYLFDNETAGRALLIVGSSNWSRQGLGENVEANVVLHLALTCDGDAAVYEAITNCFEVYWTES